MMYFKGIMRFRARDKKALRTPILMDTEDSKNPVPPSHTGSHSNHRVHPLATPSIRTMIKWIAVGDVLFGIVVMLVGYYKFNTGPVQWFGFAVAIIGGLLFLTIRLLEKRDLRKVN